MEMERIYLNYFSHISLSTMKIRIYMAFPPNPNIKLNGMYIYMLKLDPIPIIAMVTNPCANSIVIRLPFLSYSMSFLIYYRYITKKA